MLNTETYDIIVIGAGCAGLSFVSALNELSKSSRILILEQAPSIDKVPNRTWSYWTSKPDELKAYIWHEWQRWSLSTHSKEILSHSNELTYQSIKSDHYLPALLEKIKKNKNITVLFEKKIDKLIYASKTKIVTRTVSEQWFSQWVIDTRPPNEEANFELIQSFKGQYIRSSKPIFNPNVFGLMDNIVCKDNIIKFTYLLPNNHYECLIETTFLHQPDKLPDIEYHLKKDLQRFGSHHPFKVIQSEHGRLPMTAKRFRQPKHKRHIKAGQSAGGLRPSSGYGFKRIIAWAQLAAQTYHKHQLIPYPNHHAFFSHKMDQIFLNTLKHMPEQAPTIFTALAEGLNGDEFGYFMMDKANISIWRKVIQALPTKTMLKGLTKSYASANH